jgi:hypothetical protein
MLPNDATFEKKSTDLDTFLVLRPGTQIINKRLLSDVPDLQFSFGSLVFWNP